MRSYLFLFFTVLFCVFIPQQNAIAQCPSTGSYSIKNSQNWSAISGINTCSSALTTPNSTFNGDVSLNYSGSSNVLTFDINNLTINGNLVLTSTSNGNIFSIAPNTTLTIIGNLGDPSDNNLSYVLGDGAVLIVTGTIYGKNGNTISGAGGTISAGSIATSGGMDCTSCPILSVTTCNDSGSACAANNSGSSTCATNYGGTVSGNQSTCGTSLDPSLLTASGYNGTILRWESSTNGGTTWTGINNVGSTYDPPSISTTTMYRVVVLNKSSTMCNSYSTAATVSIGGAGAAGTISGPSSICKSSTGVTYTVPLINGATSYIWTYSGTGATINGNTNSITIDFSDSATPGNLTVKGTNSCGSGTISANFPITVNSGTAPTLNSLSNVTGCNGTTIAAVTATASSGTLSSIS